MLRFIGIAKTPYKDKNSAPRQGRFSNDISEIEILKEFSAGLEGISKFRYLIVLYWMHLAERDKLKATPPDGEECGVFATRSPNRPNPIGFCVVELLEIRKNILIVRWLDAVDGSPIIDIKPFFSEIDCIQ
ncbi:MAG: tRNA (N6-threonylcarbamoyladenosine(37)-N6)-methyltransferase TrmO [Archaeoglobaceae archaeon]|nr:tRNA (N6-threonylcarbamoyladenosine(37)-N6)-methyltransferase TrmO [Archaeoglobaceae archaeon]MDW8117603.1 tRNA (N6-threonylcarbamoyladenosine(37)-N6)-methyltransferase TrmO [Archaeoglobaceae archaeon]